MNKIEWDDTLSVWVAEIDMQHKVLITMINHAYNYFIQWEWLDIWVLEKELWRYTEYHFETEEKIMKSVNYPNTDDHLEEHLNFIFEISKIRESWVSKEEIVANIISFLGKWLYEHILSTDKKLGAFVQEFL
jgi:hemerythrin